MTHQKKTALCKESKSSGTDSRNKGRILGVNRRCPTGLGAAGWRCGTGGRRRRRRRGGRGRGGSGRVSTGAGAASGLVRQVVDTNTAAELLGELDDI